MSALSHYEILGIPGTASPRDIKSAYRKLAFELHPDRNSGGETSEQFFRVTQAYEALIDPIRRESYDRLQAINRQEAVAKAPKSSPPPPTAQRMRAAPKARVVPKQPDPEPVVPKVAPRPTAEEIVKLTALLTRGRLSEAERIARRMIAAQVPHAIPYAVMGDIAKMRGELVFALEMYAHAVQMDARNLLYQRKHEEVSSMISRGSRRIPHIQADERNDSGVMLVATFVVMIASAYLVMTKERAVAPEMAMISTWSWSLIAMLGLCGVVLGVALSIVGLVQRFSSSVTPGAATAMPVGVLVGVIAAFNFWLSVLCYGFMAGWSRTNDISATRLITGVGLVTLVLTGASAAQGAIDPLQTFLWGGNLVYGGAILGWIVSDAYLEETGRVK